MSRFTSVRSAFAIVGVAALGATLLTPIAHATEVGPALRTVKYVALGDSYTAAPLSSKPSGTPGGTMGFNNTENPYTCGQSNTNYPRLIARWLGLYTTTDDVSEADLAPAHPEFIDISCGGAQTKHMDSEAQTPPYGGGQNPKQLSAFERIDQASVQLVSIGIGGNDVGFGDLQTECVQKPNTGGPLCSQNTMMINKVSAAMAKLAVDLPAVLARIHELAPNAKVLVFGYPALLPEKPVAAGLPEGCWPYIPILPADIPFLRDLESRLNNIIRNAATQAGTDGDRFAHYVDWYDPSRGHDMCQPPGVAWVNGLVLAPPSFPVHPNILGSAGAARAGIAVLRTLGFQPAPARP